MAQSGNWNVARLSPMILTAVIAILVCAILVGLTDITWAAAIVVAVVILLIGVLGVWMLDKRRQTA
jgi:RsiW-degrading membrane proteinase PrsW (M82 family)